MVANAMIDVTDIYRGVDPTDGYNQTNDGRFGMRGGRVGALALPGGVRSEVQNENGRAPKEWFRTGCGVDSSSHSPQVNVIHV